MSGSTYFSNFDPLELLKITVKEHVFLWGDNFGIHQNVVSRFTLVSTCKSQLRHGSCQIFTKHIYFLHIPSGKDRWRTPLPLVLVYHGPLKLTQIANETREWLARPAILSRHSVNQPKIPRYSMYSIWVFP